MKKASQSLLILACIFVLAFIVRLYRITNPVLDWHAFRQADTASVTREYVKNGIDLLRPRYHDLSDIQSGKDNLEGYRMVEFPLVNGALAELLRLLPFLDLALVSRVASVITSLITLAAVYYIATKISGLKVGLWSAAWLALLPYSVYYSRVILPEPYMLAASTLSLAAFYRFLEKGRWRWHALALASLTLALLFKPFVLVLAPVYLAMYITLSGYKSKKLSLGTALLLTSLIPLSLWREWIKQFPTGIPASDWLLNGNGIRLRPAWWRWLFYERLTVLILGYVGMLNLAFFWLKIKKNELIIYGSWILGILAYLVIIATGNVQHDYYQVLTLPLLCILLGRASVVTTQFLQSWLKRYKLQPLLNLLPYLPYFVFVLTIALSWTKIKGYYNVNHWEYQRAGRAVDQLTPPSALVIAPAMGDTQFLFQTNRRGWPLGFNIDAKIARGATHYVTTSFDDEAKELESKYFTLQKTPEYLILDLTRPTTGAKTL